MLPMLPARFNNEALVPDVLKLAWIGGAPGPDALRAVEIWAASRPGTRIQLWTDSHCMLGNEFRQRTDDLRNPQFPTTSANPPGKHRGLK